MVKKLLSLLMFTAATMTINAQIDTSGWSEGDNVSDQLDWGDYDGTTNSGDYWKGTSAAYSSNEWENFQVDNIDRYQLVYLPAGVYTFRAQAFHRYGGQDAAAKLYFNGTAQDNYAYLYADVITVDSMGVDTLTGDEFIAAYTVESSRQKEICSNWSVETDHAIYEADDWSADSKYTYTDADGIEYVYYAPNSMAGARAYFDYDVYWNEVKVIVKTDGYVKLGVRRTGEHIGSEWLLYSNFQIVYEGNSGDAVEIELANQELFAAQSSAEKLRDEIGKTYGTLGVLLDDALMELDYDDSDVESIRNATAQVNDIIAKYNTYYSDAQSIKSLIASMTTLSETTSYSALDDFKAAIENAQTVLNDGNEGAAQTIEDPAAYSDAKNKLLEARVTYLMSAGADEKGVYDFSAAIKTPWFCNEEYNPTWDEESQQYKYADDIESAWFGDNKAWEVNCTKADEENGRYALSDKVSFYDSEVNNEWIRDMKVTSGWMGSLSNPVFIQGYTGISQWSGSVVTGYGGVHQNVTGLPDGFYSMSAMYINAGNDISEGQFAYISCGDKMEKAQFTQKYSGWWGNTRGGWQTLQTGMIQVTGGTATVGVRSDWFYAATGFHLYYYGSNPDFSAMVQTKLDEVNASATEKLAFPGDITKFNEMLAAVKMPVEGFDAYLSALDVISEANSYVNTAYNYINSWNLLNDIVVKQANYEDTTPEYAIYENLFNVVNEIGTNETDTYETAEAATNLYNSLNTYMDYRSKIAENAGIYPEITTVINSQNEGLQAEVTEEKIAAYTAELETVYKESVKAKNAELLAGLGMDKATADAPVDVTVLLTNPDFSKNKEGWDDAEGNLVVDKTLQNAERWNANFDYSQTLLALPEGCYKLTVQSFYRDGNTGGTEDGAYYNWWYAAAADTSLWENKNVQLYMNSNGAERVSYITSIASEMFTEPSFDKYVGSVVEGDILVDENGDIVYDENGNEIVSYDTIWQYYNDTTYTETGEVDSVAAHGYPFDAEVTEAGTTYYYPNSMTGAANRFAKNPESYYNEVAIMLEDGKDLKIGIRKATTISNDWCIFDNFKLYYLGKDEPEAIQDIATEDAGNGAIYNIAGQKLSAPQKGINIINGKKYLVK
jgi:hypothetical protein